MTLTLFILVHSGGNRVMAVMVVSGRGGKASLNIGKFHGRRSQTAKIHLEFEEEDALKFYASSISRKKKKSFAFFYA